MSHYHTSNCREIESSTDACRSALEDQISTTFYCLISQRIRDLLVSEDSLFLIAIDENMIIRSEKDNNANNSNFKLAHYSRVDNRSAIYPRIF